MPTITSPEFRITALDGDVSGDVTMTTAGTFYDGPSVSLTAGTWFLVGAVTMTPAAAPRTFSAKLWDGTTVESSGSAEATANDLGVSIALAGTVTVTTTTTWKISATAGANSGILKAATPLGGAGNNASHLRAIRIG